MLNFDRIIYASIKPEIEPSKNLLSWTVNSCRNNQPTIVDIIQNCVYDVYHLLMNSKELIKLLEKDGWILRGSKGSHHVLITPLNQGTSLFHTQKRI